jgi:hypothetical protein
MLKPDPPAAENLKPFAVNKNLQVSMDTWRHYVIDDVLLSTFD